MSDETAQTANTAQSNDSAPADMLPSAPEAPADTVIPPLAKDDISAQNVPESQPVEPAQTAQTGENPSSISEPILTPETPPIPPETTTAQTPPSEPVVTEPEPKPAESIFAPAEPVSKPNFARQLIAKAREAIQNRKRKKIDRVMDLFAKRTNITNNQVADFLHVSDATATRYLQILENENKIRQVGKTGKGVKYEKI
jgi:hypothetical protein